MFDKKTIIRYKNSHSKEISIETLPFDRDTGIINRVFFMVDENTGIQINYGWTEKGPADILNKPVIIFIHDDDMVFDNGIACTYILSNILSGLSYVMANKEEANGEDLTKLIEYIPDIVQLIIDFSKLKEDNVQIMDTPDSEDSDTRFRYTITHKITDIYEEYLREVTLFLPRDNALVDKNKTYQGEIILRNNHCCISYGAFPSLDDTIESFIVKIDFDQLVYQRYQIFTICQEIIKEVYKMTPPLDSDLHRLHIALLLTGLSSILLRL